MPARNRSITRNMSVTRFFICLNLPLEVNHDDLKQFLHDPHPEANSKCISTLAKYKIPLLHRCLQDALEAKLNADLDGQAVTLRPDHWAFKLCDSFQ